MEVRWKTLFTKTVIWLAAEIILNSMGLDTLADYSEFVFDKNNTLAHLTSSVNPTLLGTNSIAFGLC